MIPALPPEKRQAAVAWARSLGRRPTMKEIDEKAKDIGCAATTLRRWTRKVTPAEPQPVPGPTRAASQTSPANSTLKPEESLNPALTRAPARGPFRCSACGTEWQLGPGEAQVNTCPGCSEPFR